ncbi:MAG: DNA polymerase III subunit gamma/tau [Firmicutes bacterium]|nr:DNA polymerase III subunit gamma/tau [Bacillota bacterium]
MNYKVLYRKYRPTNFDEVVGQNNTIELLKDSIYNGKISHAYIFSGPRGTGKTSTAKIFAKTINCLACNDEKPCNKCSNCLNFSQSNDVYEIDAASNNGVDQIREIIDNIKLSPINSKYKIYIIDEVHMLSTSAFNALLLTLEEPPSHVVFILATTDIEDVPITVLSRCQRLDFKKISNKDIKNSLKSIAEKEKINIDDDALSEIAEFADGGLRDALSMLDQLSKTGEIITQEKVLNSIGLISTKSIQDLLEAIELNDSERVLNFVEKTRENSADFKTLIKKLVQVIKNRALSVKLGKYRSDMDYSDYKNLCFDLSSLLYKSNVNIDSYSLLELTLLDYVSIELNGLPSDAGVKNDREEPVNNREVITNMEKNAGDVDFVQSKSNNYFPGNNSKLIEIRTNNCFVKANKDWLKTAKELWQKYINETEDKKVKGLLLDSDIVLASDDIMVIKTDFQEKADNINAYLGSLENDFNEIYKKKYKLIAITQKRWNDETERYKQNIKNKIEYKFIDEPSEDEGFNELDDIFITKKIEVK